MKKVIHNKRKLTKRDKKPKKTLKKHKQIKKQTVYKKRKTNKKFKANDYKQNSDIVNAVKLAAKSVKQHFLHFSYVNGNGDTKNTLLEVYCNLILVSLGLRNAYLLEPRDYLYISENVNEKVEIGLAFNTFLYILEGIKLFNDLLSNKYPDLQLLYGSETSGEQGLFITRKGTYYNKAKLIVDIELNGETVDAEEYSDILSFNTNPGEFKRATHFYSLKVKSKSTGKIDQILVIAYNESKNKIKQFYDNIQDVLTTIDNDLEFIETIKPV